MNACPVVKCTNRRLSRSVLVRVYGNRSELIIDRRQEIRNFVVLSGLGLGPELYGKFTNGLVYGFLSGKAISVPDMSDPDKSKLIAENLAKWHGVQLAGERIPTLFTTLRKWLDEVPEVYENPLVNATFQANFNMTKIRKEIQSLQKRLEELDSPIVFCHCDLLYANLIYNEERNTISFIDVEYAGYNYQGFDIGNHFNEFAGFDCDFNLYPNKDFQMIWLRNYLSAAHPDHDPTREEIEKLYSVVNKFALASHCYWGLWALVQARLSEIDFDYMGYAIKRFDEYNNRKEEFLSL
ncbi:9114_t:CDS:2 [Paraglomus occultum]|uniref:ethanolamine kinase n=1 Tax=Paraglomus occultum TaxID=144539 RepID=A0A9N9AQT2_9GLOM|nr:9114_t:CDS:2 [Paraglomus occultum]